jgi:3-dehydroquinate synthase
LFAVGGGVVGDIGVLAAALYARGIEYVKIPTTLLAQVDSSVGGKTAVDLGGVKNIVGAFHQPFTVLIDPTFLQTLPPEQIKCGLGEIVKYAALSGDIFDLLEKNRGRWTELSFIETLITLCVQHKARVVEIDEKETGERRSLNVGHTTGHAIELRGGLTHGESVLYGMLLETRMAISSGICEKEYGEKLTALIEDAIELSPKANIRFDLIEQDAEKARLDKKNKDDGKITMAVAKAKGQWMPYALPFAEYVLALKEAAKYL